MTSLADFPPDIIEAAEQACEEYRSSNDKLAVVIAAAIQKYHRRRTMRPAVGGLTGHQKRVFDFIASYVAAREISPSYQEIADHLGVGSKSAVSRVVHELEERGAIKLLPNRARGITINVKPIPMEATP